MFDAPQGVATLLRDFPFPWAVCGGWAVDLFLNRATRTHKDVEVAILRPDQLELRAFLAARNWRFVKLLAGKRLPWDEEEFIPLPIYEIHCKNDTGGMKFLEILLNERDTENFLFRKDRAVVLPMERAFLTSPSGLRVLAPEIVLLYKSTYVESERDAHDFDVLLPLLRAERRAWLAGAIRRAGREHRWLAQLEA